MGWGNIYIRRMKVFYLALVIYLDYKVLQQWEKWITKSKKSSLWKKAHERNAKRVFRLMVELEGLWVKMGQYLSTRVDVIPEAYICLLKQLQDSFPPRPLKEVCRTIEAELYKSMDELFLNFDESPLATTSIAQVHRATLLSGQEIVVKVQHDGIKTIILKDLKNVMTIVDWIAWIEPKYDFHTMMDDWCKEAQKKLDFNHEAENIRKVSRNLGCKTRDDESNHVNHFDVLIPDIIQSTEKVLILEYMDGIGLNDNETLEALGVEKQKLVEEITRAYAHQIFVDGFFCGDTHLGNLLVSKEPPHRPILLDFGRTKSLSGSTKFALAKIFLASIEGNHVTLLSTIAEMGLRLHLDMSEQAFEITNVFFYSLTDAGEASENKKPQSKEAKCFEPVNTFPGDIVIFARVLNLLLGLSSTKNAHEDIMRPFAESVFQGNISKWPTVLSPQWIYETPVLSNVEAKLRQLLLELGYADKILGIQVCVYKDGKVIIDTTAGMLGRYDPRPVQPDSLFPIFSATKGITAGLMHWLVETGTLKLEEYITNIWPEFGTNGKDQIKVHHALNHTSGLHNVLGSILLENPLLTVDWNECLNQIAKSVTETEPGCLQLYHHLSFGWLCGGIIEHASGKKFQEILEEAIIHPLKIEGELYIGIPSGVESRLASLTLDRDDLKKLMTSLSKNPHLPSSLSPKEDTITSIPFLFNSLYVRRAIIPSSNGHCSARALARYYAALVDGGLIPSSSSSSSQPCLGSHPHKPDKNKQRKPKKTSSYLKPTNTNVNTSTLFSNPDIHDAFMGTGEYEQLALQDGKFGLGFKRSYVKAKDRSETVVAAGFGHAGLGGSVGLCDIENRFAMAITVNKMSMGGVSGEIVNLVCSELGIPVPIEYSGSNAAGSTSASLPNAVIN